MCLHINSDIDDKQPEALDEMYVTVWIDACIIIPKTTRVAMAKIYTAGVNFILLALDMQQ